MPNDSDDSASWFTDTGLPAGANRASGSSQLTARNDRDAVLAWLATFHRSTHTHANARKEAERLWLWAAECRGKSLSALAHEDMVLYQQFLDDPQPTARWVAAGHYARSHPDWRPFTQRTPNRPPLSRASQRQALIVLDGMFTWLVEAGWLIANPLMLSRRTWRKRRNAPPLPAAIAEPEIEATGRWLTRDEWRRIGAAIDAMPRDHARDAVHQARCRWIFALLYLAELRISELAKGRMGQFFAQMDQGAEQWWLSVCGKGGVVRKVAVTAELLSELRAYRGSMDLPGLPSPAEETPLVVAVTGRDRLWRPLSVSAIHKIVKQVFRQAIALCMAEGSEGLAKRLEKASAHWLRHSGASHMLDAGVSLAEVRDNLGHASIATTNTYIHSADQARHDHISGRHRLGWKRQSE